MLSHRAISARTRLTRLFLIALLACIPVCLALITAAPLDPSGDPDTTFSGDGKTTVNFAEVLDFAEARGIAFQSDGKIVLGGSSVEGGINHFALIRLNIDGTQDMSFGTSGRTKLTINTADPTRYDMINDVAVYPADANPGTTNDNKIVAVGYANMATNDFAIVRLNPDGALDTSFNNTGIVTVDFAGNLDRANAVAIQDDGKIVVAGYRRDAASGGDDVAVVRLNSNGTLDPTFDGDGKLNTAVGSGTGTDQAHGVAIVGTGATRKIVIGGNARNETAPNPPHVLLVQYTDSGALDGGFGSGGKSVIDVPGNSCDAIYNCGEGLRDIALQADGKIAATGTWVTWGAFPGGVSSTTKTNMLTARFTATGGLDTTFNGTGYVVTSVAPGHYTDTGASVAVDGLGRIVSLGWTDKSAAPTQPPTIGAYVDYDMLFVRFTSAGAYDSSFGTGGIKVVPTRSASYEYGDSLAIDSSNRPVVAGLLTDTGPPNNSYIVAARLTTAGVLDTTFGPGGTGGFYTQLYGGSRDEGTAVAVQSDGKVVVGGWTDTASGWAFGLVRFSANGTLDTSFSTDGMATALNGTQTSTGRAMAIYGNGKILLAGDSYGTGTPTFTVMRFASDGAIDTTFGSSGIVMSSFGANGNTAHAIALLNDTHAIVAGSVSDTASDWDMGVVKLSATGAHDGTFGTGGKARISINASDDAYAVALQPDGKILVGGRTYTATGHVFALIRLNSNGSLDNTFNTTGKVTTRVSHASNSYSGDEIRGIAVQWDGRIVVAGKGLNADGHNAFAMARYNANGTLDTTFGTSGTRLTNFGTSANSQDQINAIAMQNDGKVVAFGTRYSFDTGLQNAAIGRFNWTDGSVDTTFGTDGFVTTDFGGYDFGTAGVLATGGKPVMGGTSGANDFAAARYLGDPAPTVPSLPDLNPLSDSGRSNTDNITNDNTPTFTGTCVTGETVIIRVGGADTTPQSRGLCVGGVYAVTTAAPLLDGTRLISALASNGYGNSTVTGSLSITVDTVATAPTIEQPAADSTINPEPVISGAGAEGIAYIVMSGASNLCGATASAAGAWSCTATGLGPGSHTISVTQTDIAGNISAAASRTFAIRAPTTTVAVSAINPTVYGQPVTVNATVASAGWGTPDGTVQAAADAGTAVTGTLSGGQAGIALSGLSVGTHTITADYLGSSRYFPSSATSYSHVVNKASTTTTVSSSPNPSVYGNTVTFTATLSAVAPGAGVPGGTVVFKEGATTLGSATAASGQATLTTSALTGGVHTITAEYGGDGNFNGSTSAGFTHTVNKADQTITVGTAAPASAVYGTAFTVAATASSGLPVSYGASGACTVAGSTFTMTSGTGACTVTYTQTGNGNYNAAPPVSVDVTATKASQDITVTTAAPASAVYNGTFTVAASATSAQPVTYAGSGACSNSGATFTMTSGTGACTVTYSQAGDDNYAAAQTAATVNAAKASQTIAVGTAAPASAIFNTTFNVAATATSGAGVTYDASGACTVAGSTYTMTSGTGTCTVSYGQAGNDNYAAATAVTATVTAAKASQTITVTTASPANAVLGSTFTVAATASSSLAVAYAAEGACTVAGSTYTMTGGASTCTVKYSQSGNDNYTAATDVTASVAADKGTATLVAAMHDATHAAITFGATGSAIHGSIAINGAYGTPTGTVLFNGYDNASCSGTPFFTDTQTLASGVAESGPAQVPASRFYYQAVYSGDSTYESLTGQCSLFSVLQSGPAFVVNTLADDAGDGGCTDSHCTLREAIAAANAQAGANTITFSVTGEIRLASSLPTVTDAELTTIDGTGQTITISGDVNGDTVPDVRIITVFAGALRLDTIRIIRGRSNSAGGAIENVGTLQIHGCFFAQNTAATSGGAIYSRGQLSVERSVFSSNTATEDGGAIGTDRTAYIVASTFTGNQSDKGGAISNTQDLSLTNVTLAANSARIGGALWNDDIGTVGIASSTIANNTALDGANPAGGIYHAGAVLSIVNSILSNNTSNEIPANCWSAGPTHPISDVGNNIESANTCGFGGGSKTNTNPLLSTLGDFGGSVQTFALLPGSPAINAGAADQCAVPPHSGPGNLDARGVSRTLGGRCDIGAFESRGFTFGSLTGTPQATTVGTVFGTPLGLVVTAIDAAEPVAGGIVTFQGPATGAGLNPAVLIGTIAANGGTSVTPTANLTSGTISVLAGTSGVAANATFDLTNTRASQSITVSTPAPATATYGTSFTVAATSSSGLPVTYGASGACTVSGSTVTMTSGTGTCTVSYSHAGNGTFDAATTLTSAVTATKATQTITIVTPWPANAPYGTVFTMGATASSGLAVTYGASGACTATGATYTMTSGIGACTVTLGQAGNDNYGSTQAIVIVNAVKAGQTIGVGTTAPASAVYNTTFNVAATATSGAGVTYGASGACTVTGSTYTMTSGTGTCTVTYAQAGNDNYEAATTLTANVAATKAGQSITVGTPPPANAPFNTSFTVGATASSGLALTYAGSGACSVAGNTYTITAASGTCVVSISQAGNDNYAAAADFSGSVVAGKLTPAMIAAMHNASHAAITFGATGDVIHGAAAVNGALGTPTGTVAFNGYDNPTCSGTPFFTDTQALVVGGAESGPAQVPGSRFYYQAVYSGDSMYEARTSACSLFSVLQLGPTFVVNTLADDTGDGQCTDSHCTLREAIAAANSQAGPNTITFSENGLISLASTLPAITDAAGVTIDATGHTVTVSGDSNSDGFADVRLLQVNAGASLRLNQLWMRKGLASGVGGGGVHNAGTFEATRCVFDLNMGGPAGGAIHNSGTASIVASTFMQNQATSGGAIYNSGTLTLTNVTLALNNATLRAGGFWNDAGGNATVINTTIAANHGDPTMAGGIWNAGSLVLKNTLLGSNRSNSEAPNCQPDTPITDGGHNLEDQNTCGFGTASLKGWNPFIVSLVDYGGIKVFPLLPGSPAIDAGDPAVCSAAVGSPTFGAGNVDARGVPRTFGTGCDIGAFESRGFSLGSVTGTPQSTAVGTAFATPLGLVVTANDASEPVVGGVVKFIASVVEVGSPTSNPASGDTLIGDGGVVAYTLAANMIGGSYQVVASAPGIATPVTYELTNLRLGQTITFAPLPDKTYLDPDFDVSATTSSGLGVTFSVGATDQCTITGTTVHLTGAGSCTVTASQVGSGSYNAATAVPRTFSIAKATGTIALSGLSQTYDGTPKAVSAPTIPASLLTAVTYTGTGGTTYTTSATPPSESGTYTVAATIVDSNYQGSAAGTLTIGKATATLAFGTVTFPYDGTPKAVSVTTTPADLAGVSVTYDGSATPPSRGGTYAIAASLDNRNYAAATLQATLTITNPRPVVMALSPSRVVRGAGAFTLTVTGQGFLDGAVASWNGSARTTTVVSGAELRMEIPAADVAAAGTAEVAIVNPAPSEGASVAAVFTIADPVGTVTGLNPARVSTSRGAFTLRVSGTDFATGATVLWNGSPRVTTFVSATELEAAITGADVAAPGKMAVTVRNPTASGPTSATVFVVGSIGSDFNGDGRPDIVWRNRVTGDIIFWLMNGASLGSEVKVAGPADRAWKIAAVADFNQDDKADLFWRNATTGENEVWFMDGTAMASHAPVAAIGDADWQVAAAADFNGDGKPDLLWQHRVTGQNILWHMNGAAYAGFATVPTADDRQWVVAAADDFNGDAKPDLLWRHQSTGETIIWLMNGVSYVDYVRGETVSDPWLVAGTGDFNADGEIDVFVRNPLTGENQVAYMSGTATTGTAALPAMTNPDWDVLHSARTARPGVTDFNVDGNADILWRNSTTGESRIWYMNGTTHVTDGIMDRPADTNWSAAAVADFDRDGVPDVVWRHQGTGENAVWLMIGATRGVERGLPTIADLSWQIVAAGDMNSDGKPDLVWRNATTGANLVWYLDGTTYVGFDWLPAIADANWMVAGLADFNADGKLDLVWRNQATGMNVVWFMTGGTFAGWADLPTVADTAWGVASVADYNGDGKPDLLWRNQATGQNIVWLLNGIHYLDYAELGVLTGTWR